MSSTKRKSNVSTASTSKKARTNHETAIQSVQSILADVKGFPIPQGSEEIRRTLVDIALYARSLEEERAASKPKELTAQDVEAAAEKLRAAARSGIRKQMTWKPSCKTGSAKWVYDGVCSSANVFGALLGLDGPATFKTKKMPCADFSDLMGGLTASVRYDVLRLTSEVNIRWKPDEGTFKFSGSYGK